MNCNVVISALYLTLLITAPTGGTPLEGMAVTCKFDSPTVRQCEKSVPLWLRQSSPGVT